MDVAELLRRAIDLIPAHARSEAGLCADGRPDLHTARIRVEAAPGIAPGGRGSVRLLPITPENWRHLRVDDVITLHERYPGGSATIKEVRHPSPAART